MQYDKDLILAELERMEILLDSHLRQVRGWNDAEMARAMFLMLSRMRGKAKFSLESCEIARKGNDPK